MHSCNSSVEPSDGRSWSFGQQVVKELAAALLYRGMSERDVTRVLGGNFLRVFDDATKAAALT